LNRKLKKIEKFLAEERDKTRGHIFINLFWPNFTTCYVVNAEG
jgi:hypothetical protein